MWLTRVREQQARKPETHSSLFSYVFGRPAGLECCRRTDFNRFEQLTMHLQITPQIYHISVCMCDSHKRC